MLFNFIIENAFLQLRIAFGFGNRIFLISVTAPMGNFLVFRELFRLTRVFRIANFQIARVDCSLNTRTHCRLLPLIVDDHPIHNQLHRSFVNFFSSLLASSTACIIVFVPNWLVAGAAQMFLKVSISSAANTDLNMNCEYMSPSFCLKRPKKSCQ